MLYMNKMTNRIKRGAESWDVCKRTQNPSELKLRVRINKKTVMVDTNYLSHKQNL